MASSDVSLPFGLAVAAREPVSTGHVDLVALVFDHGGQIMLVSDACTGVPTPWCRPTDGKTTTNSNTDGQGGRETDEDWTED